MNGELRAMLVKHYQQHIANHPSIPHELKIALKSNERVPAFLDNLVVEFSKPYFKQISNNKIRDYSTQMIDLFINLVRQKANERMMSEAAKYQVQKNIENKQVIDNAVTSGIIDEEVLSAIQDYDFKKEESPKTET